MKSGDRTVETFVVYPEVSQKTPVIIVIHDIQGMTEWPQSFADELAEAGYIAAAPDLGKRSPDQVLGDLNAVVEYARSIPACNGKIAAAGFDEQAVRFAAKRSDLAAVYVFGPKAANSSVIAFPGPPDFMRLGDAPNASAADKKAREDAWERWKKLLVKL